MKPTTLDRIAEAIELALIRAGIATTVTTHTPDPSTWAGPDPDPITWAGEAAA